MRGGHAADSVQAPVESQPKSKPAMLMHLKRTDPAFAAGEFGRQVTEGVTMVVGVGVEGTNAPVVAAQGMHCE